MTRAAIYVRVSNTLQEDNYSLKSQEEECRQYCEQHGYIVDKDLIFKDVHSGIYLYGRKGAEDVLEAIRMHRVDVVVAHAIDRLSRNQNHLGLFLSEAEHHGARLEFVTETLDDTPYGKFLRSAVTFAGELEREKLKERSQRGRRARAKAGMPLHGRRPLYGYQWNEDKTAYTIYEPEAAIVRRIFTEYAEGKTIRGITEGLKDDSVSSPCNTGEHKWWQGTVHNILKREAYWGQAKAFRNHAKWQRVETEFGDRDRRVKRYVRAEAAELIDISAGVPAIITDLEMVEAIQQRLKYNQMALVGRKGKRTEALLRGGFAVCGYCGRKMAAMPRQCGTAYYRCSSHSYEPGLCSQHTITVHILDQLIWRQVKKILTQPDIVAAELEKQRTADPTAADIAGIDRLLADIKRKHDNLTRGLELLQDEDNLSMITAQLDRLAAQKRGYEQERAEMVRRREAWQLTQQRIDNLQVWCQALLAGLTELTYEQKRETLYALDVTVKVYRKDHTPRWEFEANIPVPENSPKLSHSS